MLAQDVCAALLVSCIIPASSLLAPPMTRWVSDCVVVGLWRGPLLFSVWVHSWDQNPRDQNDRKPDHKVDGAASWAETCTHTHTRTHTHTHSAPPHTHNPPTPHRYIKEYVHYISHSWSVRGRNFFSFFFFHWLAENWTKGKCDFI